MVGYQGLGDRVGGGVGDEGVTGVSRDAMVGLWGGSQGFWGQGWWRDGGQGRHGGLQGCDGGTPGWVAGVLGTGLVAGWGTRVSCGSPGT